MTILAYLKDPVIQANKTVAEVEINVYKRDVISAVHMPPAG